jgi:hypothetical protein
MAGGFSFSGLGGSILSGLGSIFGGGAQTPVVTPTVDVGATSQVATPTVSPEMASLPKFNAIDNPRVKIDTPKVAAPKTTTPQTQSGLGGGGALKGLADVGGVVVAGLQYMDDKKQQKKDNKVTEWKLAQQTKAANNKLKWSKCIQQSLEGEDVSPENERQQYDSAPKLT